MRTIATPAAPWRGSREPANGWIQQIREVESLLVLRYRVDTFGSQSVGSPSFIER
jgi:hypothetical protein